MTTFPQVSVTAITNGSEVGGIPAVFRFSRTGPTTDALSVNYRLLGTTQAGSDYTGATSGTISFLAGSETADLSLAALPDMVVDPNETIIVEIVQDDTIYESFANNAEYEVLPGSGIFTPYYDSNWTDGQRSYSTGYFTDGSQFLSPIDYGSGQPPYTNGQAVYKSYSLSSSPATISLDFIRLDSWDNESFKVYINDTVAFIRSFSLDTPITGDSGTINGFSWTITPKSEFGIDLGVASYNDQIATITITLPTDYPNFNKIGFGSTLDSEGVDESYGIDNLTITPRPRYSISATEGSATATILEDITAPTVSSVAITSATGIQNSTAQLL